MANPSLFGSSLAGPTEMQKSWFVWWYSFTVSNYFTHQTDWTPGSSPLLSCQTLQEPVYTYWTHRSKHFKNYSLFIIKPYKVCHLLIIDVYLFQKSEPQTIKSLSSCYCCRQWWQTKCSRVTAGNSNATHHLHFQYNVNGSENDGFSNCNDQRKWTTTIIRSLKWSLNSFTRRVLTKKDNNFNK